MRIFSKRLRRTHRSPGWRLIVGYSGLITVGTLLLMLPVSTTAGYLNLVDAIFTAASAVCVTGLTVVDTPGTFTLFGKIIILMLIQIGGIGIMVFSTIFLLSLGKRVSMAGRLLIRDTYSYDEGNGNFPLVKDILIFTIAIEFFGALVMFFRFHKDMPAGKAFFYSVFHAISAFCNAGFSLFSTSFVNFKSDWILNLTLCALIILGGIGFVVLSEIKNTVPLSRRTWGRFSLHTRLVLSSTALLLITSTVLILLLEWQNNMTDTALSQKILNAFFHAVNTRTAGFNITDIGALTNGTLFFTIILMFIGTAPGSCGGGVKVTTFSSIIILGISRLLGQEYPQIFNRKISNTSITKAVSVIMISIFTVILGIMVLQQTEIGEISHPLTRGVFLELMFETVSAFGTVGLSTGITGTLSVPGKLIITIMMFIGRLGPLVIAMTLSRTRPPQNYYYAQENIMIG